MPQVFPRFQDIDISRYQESIEMLEVEGRATVALNMVSSLDGRAIVDGKSTSLGGDLDGAVFHRLRELCEALIVGDGTVNAENYQDLI